MIQYFDIEKIITDVTPPSLRKQNIIEWLNACLINTKNRNDEFNSFQFEKWRNYSILPQTMAVEFLVNTIVPLTGFSIYILDGDLDQTSYQYFDSEYNPNQLYEYFDSEGETPESYAYFNSEIDMKSFYVLIPSSYETDTTIKEQISNIIDRLRPYGMTWSYEFY